MKEIVIRKRRVVTWEVQFYHDKTKTWQEWNSFKTYKEAKKFYDDELGDVRIKQRITLISQTDKLIGVK